MSGIEVAGLALGAFPLMLAALDHYQRCAEFCNMFMEIWREHGSWVQDLRIGKVQFANNLEILLLTLHYDDDQVKDLMQQAADDPKLRSSEAVGTGWRDPELLRRLEEEFPRSHGECLAVIERINGVIEEIQQVLKLDKLDFKPTSESGKFEATSEMMGEERKSRKKTAKFLLHRFHLTISEPKRTRLFEQLARDNDTLHALLDRGQQIARLRQDRGGAGAKFRSQLREMWSFWQHADRLYRLLKRSWSCECRKLHLASLRLQHRMLPSADPGFHKTPEFCVVFDFGPRNCQEAMTAKAWTSQETLIEVLELPTPVPQHPTRRSGVSFADDNTAASALCPATPTPSSPSMRGAVPRSTSPTPSSTSTGEANSEHKSLKSVGRKFFRGFGKPGKEKSSLVPIVSTVALPSAQGDPPSPYAALSPPLLAVDKASSQTRAPCAAAADALSQVITPPKLVVTNSTDSVDAGPEESESGMIDIVNLCAEIPNFSAKSSITQPPFYLKDVHCRAALKPVRTSRARPSSGASTAVATVSLETLLRSDTPRTFTRCERYQIALTLASSFVQLKLSPWIRRAWGKRDIFFFQKKGGGPEQFKLDQPYISRDFLRAEEEEEHDDDEDDEDSECDDACEYDAGLDPGDRSVSCLGIMLLELCLGTVLEEQPLWRAMSQNDTLSSNADVNAAQLLVPRIKGDAGEELGNAIKWCLDFTPRPRAGKWREELFETVVKPLREHHFLMDGTKGGAM